MPQPLSTALLLRRHPERAMADRAAAFAVLDEARVCHVGFVENGRPWVIPTTYGRDGEVLYLHGAAVGRLMRTLTSGLDVCVTVTLLDGLVLARSAFAHSMNYRSVLVAGTAVEVVDIDAKLHALRCIVDHVLPGRWEEVRQPTPQELDATSVLVLPLDNLSAKVRSGAPVDSKSDRALTLWAGDVPLRQVVGEPRPDGAACASLPLPPSVVDLLDEPVVPGP